MFAGSGCRQTAPSVITHKTKEGDAARCDAVAVYLLHVLFETKVDSAACTVLHRRNVHATQGEAGCLLLFRAAAATRCKGLQFFAGALQLEQSERLLNECFRAATGCQRGDNGAPRAPHDGMQALLPEDDAAGRQVRDIFATLLHKK